MGIFSSESSSSTLAPTTGSQTSNAPSSSNSVSGNKGNTTINVSNTATDYGALEGSLALVDEVIRNSSTVARDGIDAGVTLGRDAIDSNTYVAETAIYENSNSLRDIINFGQGILDGAANVVRDAMREASFQTENALATAEYGIAAGQALSRDAIDSNNAITKDSLYLSQSVVDLTDDLYEQSQSFLTGTMTNFTDTVIRLDNSRNAESTNTLDKITELATVVQTGGESLNANFNKMIAGLAIVTAGAIAWRALK